MLTSMGMAAFLAATVIGFYFRSLAAGILCLVLAALDTARVIYLIRIGKQGWESRVAPADNLPRDGASAITTPTAT